MDFTFRKFSYRIVDIELEDHYIFDISANKQIAPHRIEKISDRICP